MRQLGNKLAREAKGAPGQYHVLLSHVHWDHIQGLPFFSPAYIPGTKISVYALLTAADELNQVIGGITRHASREPRVLETDYSFPNLIFVVTRVARVAGHGATAERHHATGS